MYCNTKEMLADYFTKPLQGSLFKRFRDVIMGVQHPDSIVIPTSIDTASQERVATTSRVGDLVSQSSGESIIGAKNIKQEKKKIRWSDVVRRSNGRDSNIGREYAYDRRGGECRGS